MILLLLIIIIIIIIIIIMVIISLLTIPLGTKNIQSYNDTKLTINDCVMIIESLYWRL